MTYQEAAKLAEVKVGTIQKWISRGVRGIKLPRVRVGGRCFILREDFEQWLADVNAPNPAKAKAERRRKRFSERKEALRKQGLDALARIGFKI